MGSEMCIRDSGFLWALDFPIRRTLYADFLNNEALGKAITLDSVTNNFTRFLGPIAGGLFVEYVGLKGVFLMGSFLYMVAAVVAIKGIQNVGKPVVKNHESFFSGIQNGLKMLVKVRLLFGIMLVTLIYNLWGFPFVSMIPVIGKEVMFLNPVNVGLHASAEGLGVLTGAS